MKGGGDSATAQVMMKMRGMKMRGMDERGMNERGMKSRAGGDAGDRLLRRMMGKCCARCSMKPGHLQKDSRSV